MPKNRLYFHLNKTEFIIGNDIGLRARTKVRRANFGQRRLYVFTEKSNFNGSRRFGIERDCHRDSEYSFEQGNSMVNMLIKSLNGMHLNQDHGYQYHIFSVQNTKIRGDKAILQNF